MLCPGCLAPGPRLTGTCSTCGAQRHLRGRYWIEAVLGRDGPVRTLRAREGSSAIGNPGEGRLVVLRERTHVREREPIDVDALARAVRRVDDVAATRSGLPRLLDSFEAPRGGLVHRYVVEEWIDGRSLAEELAAGARFDDSSARALADELLVILAALHGHDPPQVHGAIRPSHILTRADAAHDGGPRHVLVGHDLLGEPPTPGYAPLSQLLGRASPASDLHALGATLLALLAGQDAASLVDPETQTIPLGARPDLGPALTRVLARMVAPKANDRFAAVADVQRALDQAATAVVRPVAAAPVPAPAAPAPAPAASTPATTSATTHPARSRPRVVAAIAGVGAVLLIPGAPPWAYVLVALLVLLALRRPRPAASSRLIARTRAAVRPLEQAGASDDPVIVDVGWGLAGAVVGESTVADVLAAFGSDCMCHCYDHDSIPGPEVAADPRRYPRVWMISYDYDEDGRYFPSRPVNERRPSSVRIDTATGRVERLDFGVYQRAVRTREGLRQGGALASMLALYGDRYAMRAGDALDLYDYAIGVEVWVSRSEATINSFKIHAARP